MFPEKFNFIKYCIILAGSSLFSFLINSLFLRFSSNLGIRSHDDVTIRWSKSVKPAFGGISFYISFLISIAAYFILFNHSNFIINRQLLGLLTACTFAFLMGLADDAYNTKPVLKISVQLLCSFVLAYTGNYIKISDLDVINYSLTVIWVIGIMNSVNMLDNMDGIASIVALAVISGALATVYLLNDFSSMDAVVLIGMIGALSGFLLFNFYPSKIFMGDTGSQFLGIFLAATGIRFFWNNTGQEGEIILSRQFMLVLLAFIIPITDTATVVINRISAGKSPFIGGKDHTTHHLFYRGVTERRIFVLLGFLSFLSVFIDVLFIKFIQWNRLSLVLSGIYAFIIFFSLFRITRKK